MELIDKVALITGGTMGIGGAICEELARRGAAVGIVARHSGPEARQVQTRIEYWGRACLVITGETYVTDGGLTSRIA